MLYGAGESSSRQAVAGALAFLTNEGYVLARPRQGVGATQYVLSGTSRLIFGGSVLDGLTPRWPGSC